MIVLSSAKTRGSRQIFRICQETATILTWLICVWMLAVLTTTMADECTLSEQGTQECVSDVECGLYMAPSTIEGSNLGIYTAKPLEKDAIIDYPEMVIPLLFREWKQGDHKTQDGALWDRYIWEGGIAEIASYTDTRQDDSRAVFIPGVGCSVNSRLDLRNVRSAQGSYYDASVPRGDPGAGGFTPYHGAATRVVVDQIPAGSELFASYGDYWIPDVPGAKVTFDEVMDEANDFLENDLLPFVERHAGDMSVDMMNELYQAVRTFPLHSQMLTVLPEAPWTDIKGVTTNTNDAVRQFLNNEAVRSPEWLRQHGYCQDHLYPGPSIIPHAGKGAFAARNLPQGTVVGYAPLIHVGEHGHDLFRVPETGSIDLVINYSFGHPNSTIILTPYGSMVNYINHDGLAPNVRVQWPRKTLLAHQPEWLTRNTTFLANTIKQIGLSLEYVAIRDIRKGEEVTMDYGRAWEAAWEEHVQTWRQPDDANTYQHSTQLKDEYFRTQDEQQTNPYPDNLVTMCYRSFRREGDAYFWLKPLRLVPDRVYCDVRERHFAEDGSPLYLVAMKIDDVADHWVLVNLVTADGIFLYDRAWSEDWHLPGAFRHPMGIPDDIMPESWLNERESSRVAADMGSS